MLCEHSDGGLQILDGLDAVQLAAVRLRRLLLTQGGGRGEGLLVLCSVVLELLDGCLQLAALCREALDCGSEVRDLCLRRLDGLRLRVLIVVAPASQLVVEGSVLVHLLLQGSLHLLEQTHHSGHRCVLDPAGRAGPFEGLSPCLQQGALAPAPKDAARAATGGGCSHGGYHQQDQSLGRQAGHGCQCARCNASMRCGLGEDAGLSLPPSA
mmetsp:Transcript_68151/g.145883  ORF Transcript_68151/g.145883 Transcript_68151/m.145883 type:complete len:211 (+) Transcript_68151:218-850(+)